MKIKLYQKNGFSILAVILVIVVVIVAIGAWGLSGQSNSANNAKNSIDVQAANLLNDGLAFKNTYEKYKLQGVNQNNITYVPNTSNTATTFNLADPTVGISIPTISSQIINSNPTTNEGYWAYLKFVATPLGRTMGGNDYEKVMVVGGIKDSVCKRINYSISGNESIINLNGTSDTLLSGISKTTPNTEDSIYFPPGISIGYAGCGGRLAAQPDKNIFYVILQIN